MSITQQKFNEKIFYAYKFLSACLPIYAFYTLLFKERGHSITEIALLLSLWSVFTIIFEIPAGVLADRWNRRNMLLLASISKAICFIIWFFSHSFPIFALGFVFWGISGAFKSGTEEGLIYDNLKFDNRKEDFTEVYGKAEFYGNIGIIMGIISAGILAIFTSIGVIALISAVICLMNVFIICQLREKNLYTARLGSESVNILQTFKEATTFLQGNKAALIVMFFLVVVASIGSYLDEFDALIINDFQLDHLWVSAIFGIRFAFIAIGDILAPKVQKKLKSIRQIFTFNILAGIFLLLFAFFWRQHFLLIFGLSFMVMAITEILLINKLQNQIKEEGRATVMSLYGIGQNVIMILFSLVYAALAGFFTLQQVYMIISIYCIVGTVLFLLVVKDNKGVRRNGST